MDVISASITALMTIWKNEPWNPLNPRRGLNMNKQSNGHDDDVFYPEGLVEGYKKLDPIQGQRSDAPRIRWGHQYQEWPDERKIAYLEKFASSMNHAADLLQQERNELLKKLRRAEDQIKSLSEKHLQQGDLMHRELQKQGEQQQLLNQRIVELVRERQALRQEVERLRGGRE